MSTDPTPRHAAPRDSTLCARAPLAPPSVSVPLVPSLDLSVVYRIADLDQIDGLNEGRLKGFSYARDSHPNAVQLAGKIAAIEGAEAGLVCASGMAAIASTLLALLNQGDHVVLSDGLYGKTTTLVARELLRFGITHDRFDSSRPDSLSSLITSRTRLIVAETISNPLLRVADLEATCRVAREARVPVLVDHTFAPLLCKPIELGATFVMHSVTKLIGGHSDLTCGAVAGPRESIDRIASVASTFGQTGNPFESWLALRGMATLSLRSARASATALDLAGRLESHPGVARVYYPGLRSHPDFDLARRTAQGRLRRDGRFRRWRPRAGRSPDPLASPHPLRPQPGRRANDPEPSLHHQPQGPGPGHSRENGHHARPDPPLGRPGRPGRSVGGFWAGAWVMPQIRGYFFQKLNPSALSRSDLHREDERRLATG